MSEKDPTYTPPDISLVGDEHVRRYEETDGTVGHEWNGATCLVLTTTGRKTGQSRKNALIYARDGDNYVVVASMGGAPKHPTWYLNLQADATATIQVGAERHQVLAQTASGSERARLWQLVNERWPNYDVYATRTDREIPVVVLRPAPSPTAVRDLPASVEDALDPSWLTSALSSVGTDERVVAVEQVGTSKTIAEKIRFRATIEGADGSQRTDAYCLKSQYHGSPGGAGSEALFYRDLSHRLDVRTPRAYFAEVNDDRSAGMIIMDDVYGIGGTFMSAHDPYSLETTRDSLSQLARLHSATWGGNGVAGAVEWLVPSVAGLFEMFPMDLLQTLLDDGRANGLPTELRDAEQVVEAVRRVIARPTTCVIHADTHSGNTYVDADGRACWLDWQLVQPGHWAIDISYHLATVLDIESRRDHEQELLRHYLDELAMLGVPRLDWDDAWAAYSTSFSYGYYLWSITRISSREVVMIHIPRLAAALMDHDTYHKLGLH